MGINAVKQQGEEIVKILRDENYFEFANDIESAIKKLDSSPEVALDEIIGMCHIKVLGDTYTRTIDIREWERHVNKLLQKANRALKQVGNK